MKYHLFFQARFFALFMAIMLCCSAINSTMAAALNKGKQEKIQLQSFVATYVVSAMGLEGIAVTNSLTIHSAEQGQKYHFKSHSKPIGLLALKKDETRKEQSEGLIINGIIQPGHYSYVQTRNGSTLRNIELNFDWQKKQVSNHHKHKNSKWLMPIPDEALDKLSYQLSLMLILGDLTNEKHSAKEIANKQFSLSIADGGKLKHYNFTLLGEEQITIETGSYQAIKVRHQRNNKDRVITLWCVPELNYLPVKIIQDESGKPQFISTLTSYKNINHNKP